MSSPNRRVEQEASTVTADRFIFEPDRDSLWWEFVFRDRTDAGNRLAEELSHRRLEVDLVLGVPRGALPVARPVADALGVPLDVAVARKMGAPGNPEYAIGAAASDGSVYLDEGTIDRLGIDQEYVERERERAADVAREKAAAYRQGEPRDVTGKTVVVVDDGVATGAR